MATYTDRGSGTPATTGTTWASATSAVDGTPPANPATYATMTNAVSAAVATIEITGYDFGTVLPASGTAVGELEALTNISVSLRHFENNTGRFASVAITVWDGATQIGGSNACTLATAARNDAFTYTPTLAQLKSSTFKVRITITGAANTQSRIFSIDHVDVVATYVVVAAKVATLTEAFTTGTAWTTVAGTPAVTGGQMVLDYISPSPGESVMSNVDYDLTESSVYCKFTNTTVNGATQQRSFRFTCWADASNWVGMFCPRSTSGTHSILSDGRDNAGNIGGGGTGYTPASCAYARLRLAGTTFGLDRSPDGTNWTQVTTITLSAALVTKLKHCFVRFEAFQAGADATDTVSASIDAVNMIVTATGGRPKVYVASAFTTKPAKVWSGSAWNEKPVKVWTGSTWKTLT